MKTPVDLDRIKATAEAYYRNGDYYCSEAIVRTIRDEFGLDLPDEVIALSSGFPVGMGGSGCTCGAIAGGTMAIGMFFGRTQPKDPRVDQAMALSRELHDAFLANHRSVCCRVLTKGMVLGSPDHMDQCIAFTGEVALKTARLIVRELEVRTV